MNLKGAQSVTGPTTFTGKVNINGDVDINGPLDVLGVWKLTGNGDIVGDVDITGILRLLSELIVSSGGKITVQGAGGSVILDSSYSSPRITLGTAQIVGGSGGSLTLSGGGKDIYLTPDGVRIPAMLTRQNTGLPAGAVGADPDGTLWRAA